MDIADDAFQPARAGRTRRLDLTRGTGGDRASCFPTRPPPEIVAADDAAGFAL
jgi:hypothetical protein